MNKTLVIAEIGVNHNGEIALAHKMVEMAKDAGCDVAKFQFYDPLKVLGAKHPALEYAQHCQFNKYQHEDLKKHCDQIRIEYLVSVFNVNDLPWANSVCQRMKVATRMNQNSKFIEECRNTGKPVYISTTEPYITAADELIYLYCLPKYPTAVNDLSRTWLEACEGLSTHCPSIDPALYAVSKHCKVVEAHVTVDRNMKGCDMSSSWTFQEMKRFVSTVRAWEGLK